MSSCSPPAPRRSRSNARQAPDGRRLPHRREHAAIVKGLGLLKVDRYALPNVLAGATIAPELIQDDCTPEKLAAAVLAWFDDPDAILALEPRYRDLHLALRRDASAQAATAVDELLSSAHG